MRRDFVAFLLMTACLSGCIHPVPQFYKEQRKAFVDLYQYIEEKRILDFELDSFMFCGRGESQKPCTMMTAAQDDPSPISIDKARVYAVNATLCVLNFYNSKNGIGVIWEDKDKLATLFNSLFMVDLGEFKDPLTARRIPGDIGSVFLKQGKVFYVERFGAIDTAFQEETFTEAVDLLKEQGKLYYPEYLKWVEGAESDHSSKLQESP